MAEAFDASAPPVEGSASSAAAAPEGGSRLALAAGLMAAASVCLAAMGALVKLTSREVSPLSLVFGRSLIVALLALLWMRGRRLGFAIPRPGLLAWRCLCGGVAMVLYFVALAALPLSTTVTIQYLSPVLVALLSGLVVREPVSRTTLGLVALAFVGAALVLSPEIDRPRIEVAAALVSSLLMAFAYLAVRGLRHSQSAASVVFYFAVFCTLATSPWAPELVDVSPASVLSVGGIGLAAFAGQLLMTQSYHHAEAAFVTAFAYCTVIAAALIGLIAFDEALAPAAGVGIAVQVGAGVAISLHHRKRSAEA